MVTRGGAKRPHKPAGRKPGRIGFQDYCRRQVHAGYGHNAEGQPLKLDSERRTSIELGNGYGIEVA